MKKSKTPTAEDCVARLRQTTEALAGEGAAWDLIAEAHVTMTVEAGWKSRAPETVFDAAEKAFGNAAYSAFEGEKTERAKKRRKSLGLPEE